MTPQQTLETQERMLCEFGLHRSDSGGQVQTLEQARHRYAQLFQAAPIGYLTLDKEGNIRDVNRAAATLVGLEKDQLVGQPFAFLVAPGDQKLFAGHLKRCRRAGRTVSELRLSGARRQPVTVQMISVLYHDHDTPIFQMALIDRTQQRQAEATAQHACAFADSIVQTIREPLLVLDDQLRVVSVNPAFCQCFAATPAAVLGQLFDDLLHRWWCGNSVRAELERVLATDAPVENILIETDIAGKGARSLLLNARRLVQEGRQTGCLLVALEDVTERRRMEAELRRANEELETRVQSRTQALQESLSQMEAFSYTIAHDLRGPLRGMEGFAATVLEDCAGVLDDKARSYLQRIRGSAQRLDALIHDLLEYSRLNTAHLPTHPVALSEAVHNVITHLEHEIQQKHANVCCPDSLPIVQGNRAIIHTVISNLLSNALKFVPGELRPEISVGCEDHGRRVRLWIQDNGIGIDSEHQLRIFRVFERLHTHAFPGTGIGLAIVKKGIERIGGTVGLESAPGHGSRFWLELMKAEQAVDAP